MLHVSTCEIFRVKMSNLTSLTLIAEFDRKSIVPSSRRQMRKLVSNPNEALQRIGENDWCLEKLNPNACKGFLECSFLAQLHAPSCCPSTSLCSKFHHCLIVITVKVHGTCMSYRLWNSCWSRLSSSKRRDILSLCTTNNNASKSTLAWILSPKNILANKIPCFSIKR